MQKPVLFVLLLIGIMPYRSVADEPAADEWVDIPVVVNIIDASDASKLDDAVKKANEILGQAHIRLVVKKTNKDVAVGDGDGKLTEEEGDQASKDGQKELDKTFKDKDGKWDGKGIKVTVADDGWVEDPNNIGWALHRIPVVVVEAGEADQMGSTIAHELMHALTIEGHSTDPNNVMYESDEGGTKIDEDQIKEIYPEAKKRGDAYSKLPSLIPGTYSLAPSGVAYHLDGYGAMLDPFGDVICVTGVGCPNYNPNDPFLAFADLQEVSLFADDPSTPGSMARFEVNFGGLIPQSPGQTGIFILVNLDSHPTIPGSDARLTINGFDSNPSSWQAILQPTNPPLPQQTLPIQLHLNEQFDGAVPIPHHHSLEVLIPIEIIPLYLASVDPIQVRISSRAVIPYSSPLLVLDDIENSFSYDLSVRSSEDPSLNFLPNGVAGFGFHPNTNVEIRVNDLAVGIVATNTNGVFEFDGLPLNPPPGEFAVITKEIDEGFDFTPAHAIGFFRGGVRVAAGDIDGDGCVDLNDFSIMAGQWVVGCPPNSM